MSDKTYATAPFNFIPFPEKVLIRYTAAESLPGMTGITVRSRNMAIPEKFLIKSKSRRTQR